MDDEYELIIPLKPVSWSASKVTRYGSYDPKSKEKEAIRRHLHALWRYKPLLSEPIEAWFCFGFEPPKSTSKKRRKEMIEFQEPHIKHIDTTNLIKLAEDCLNQIVIEDDRLIFKTHGHKYWSYENHIRIVLKEHPYAIKERGVPKSR